MKNFKIAALSLLCLGVAIAPQANASIITTLTSNTVSGGIQTFVYNVDLTKDQQIIAGQAAFGTVYDFGPINGSITSTGLLNTSFTFTTPSTNTPAALTTPTDTALANIRFTANSTLNLVGFMNLGTFTVSSLNLSTKQVNFDGQANVQGGAANGTQTGNIGFVLAPTASTPEPATLFSLGAGLFALGLVRRSSRKA